MVTEMLAGGQRRQMLREQLRHEEANNRAQWEMPPIGGGDHLQSYAGMMLDPTVSYCVGLLQEAVVSAGYAVVPQGRSRAQLLVARWIESNLANLPIADNLHDATDGLWRGFRAHEVTWVHSSISAAGRPTSHRFDLAELAALSPDQMTLDLDGRMRVLSITSKPIGFEPQTVAADKLWMHRNRPSRTRPAGESILDPAWRPWSSKNRLLQFWGTSIQRFGMQALKATVGANTTAARQQQILDILYQGRLDGVYIIPDDCIVEAMNPTQWANLTFEAALDYQDAEIAKCILFIYQPGGSATGQTYVTGAGLSEQARATSIRLARISGSLGRSLTDQVVAPLVAANFGGDPELVPHVMIGKPDAGRIVTMAVPLSQLVAAGIADPETAAEQLDLPEPTVKLAKAPADHALTVG